MFRDLCIFDNFVQSKEKQLFVNPFLVQSICQENLFASRINVKKVSGVRCHLRVAALDCLVQEILSLQCGMISYF